MSEKIDKAMSLFKERNYKESIEKANKIDVEKPTINKTHITIVNICKNYAFSIS